MRAKRALFETGKATLTRLRALAVKRIVALNSTASSTMSSAVLKHPTLARIWGAEQADDVVYVAGAGLLVALAYYVGAQVGFALRFPGSPLSIIWPPNALLLTALLLTPPHRRWVLVLVLAVLPAHLLVALPNAVRGWTIPGTYITNCAEALLGAWGVRRFSGGPPWLGTLRAVI